MSCAWLRGAFGQLAKPAFTLRTPVVSVNRDISPTTAYFPSADKTIQNYLHPLQSVCVVYNDARRR
jgi:hypothetical protein